MCFPIEYCVPVTVNIYHNTGRYSLNSIGQVPVFVLYIILLVLLYIFICPKTTICVCSKFVFSNVQRNLDEWESSVNWFYTYYNPKIVIRNIKSLFIVKVSTFITLIHYVDCRYKIHYNRRTRNLRVFYFWKKYFTAYT